MCVRSVSMVTFTGPSNNCALTATPSACEMRTDGIVMVGSAPPNPAGAPGALSAMITANAPAFCAFFTFTTKVQTPRSIRAIFPATAGVTAAQPRLGSYTKSLVIPGLESGEPKPAVPIGFDPAIDVGEF